MSVKIFFKKESDSVYTSINHHEVWEWRRSSQSYCSSHLLWRCGGRCRRSRARVGGTEILRVARNWIKKKGGVGGGEEEIEMDNALKDAPSRSTTAWTGEKISLKAVPKSMVQDPARSTRFQHSSIPEPRRDAPGAGPCAASSTRLIHQVPAPLPDFRSKKTHEIMGCSSLATCPCLRVCHQPSYCPL